MNTTLNTVKNIATSKLAVEVAGTVVGTMLGNAAVSKIRKAHEARLVKRAEKAAATA